MKKLLTLFGAVAFFATSALAQIDRLEISASYGFAPATGIIKDMYELKIDDINFNSFKDADKWGALTGNFNLRLTEKFAIGLSYTYSQLSQNAGVVIKGVEIPILSKQDLTYNSLMLNLKKAWVETRFITVYSRLAGGITLIKLKSNKDSELSDYEESKKYAAFQISPIGVEVGNNIAVFMEGGFGTMGVLQGGVRLRL